MRLFKIKRQERNKIGWNDITLKDMMEIKEISTLQLATEDEKNLKVASVVCKVPYDELMHMPLEKVREYMDQTEFLFTKPKPKKAMNFYIVNGRRYKLLKNEMEMLTSQYIDFQAIYKDGFEKRPGELLSVMMVPEGHEYNDGYDKERVIDDMYDMKVEEALGIVDFFTQRLKRLMEWTRTYFNLRVRMLRIMAPKDQKEMYRAMEIQLNLMMEELSSIYGWIVQRP